MRSRWESCAIPTPRFISLPYYTKLPAALQGTASKEDLTVPAVAATNTAGNDMWTVAQNLIVDIYNHIAGISTVLAGLMSAISVIGVKLSGNQHKADQAWDWLKRIWVAWAIINGIGAFIAYITPQFSGFNTLTP